MTVKPWAGFIADFPDDQVGDGWSIDVFGGRNVAVAIGEMLAGLGCSEVSAPDYAEEKGWEFDFYDEGGRRFWCQVTSFHPAFWLLFEDPALTRGTKARNAAAYAEMWRTLAAALDRDPRFHDIVCRSMDDGPPEPEDIGSPAARKRSASIAPVPLEDELSPLKRETPQSSWLWLPAILALWGVLTMAEGLIGRIGGLHERRIGDFKGDMVLGAIMILGSGFWALRRFRSRSR